MNSSVICWSFSSAYLLQKVLDSQLIKIVLLLWPVKKSQLSWSEIFNMNMRQ